MEERRRSSATDGELPNPHSRFSVTPTITIQNEKDITTVLSNGDGEGAQPLAVEPAGRRASSSPEREKDTASKGRKVQRMLKDGVHKGQARINTVSKKIGNGVKKGAAGTLQRTHSLPGQTVVVPAMLSFD